MIKLRKSAERGHFDFGWLDTYHTFSFGEYFDRNFMGFSALRVINEDRVQAGQGFGEHPHKDMEIFTWVLDGALEHKDSLGNGSIIRPGDAQIMSAGTGIHHSEFNPSPDKSAHLLQIWLLPERKGLAPRYDQKQFPAGQGSGRMQLLVSQDGRDGSLIIHQDAAIYSARLAKGESADYTLQAGRKAWVQAARGSVAVNGQTLQQGDGAAIEAEASLALIGQAEKSEALVFDLP